MVKYHIPLTRDERAESGGNNLPIRTSPIRVFAETKIWRLLIQFRQLIHLVLKR